MSNTPTLHHKAHGVHPGAFVQATAPVTADVQDGVLWVDTSTAPPFALRCWRAAIPAWEDVGTATAPGSGVSSSGSILVVCLSFSSYGASICNDMLNILHFHTPDGAFTMDTAGLTIPGGHRFQESAVP